MSPSPRTVTRRWRTSARRNPTTDRATLVGPRPQPVPTRTEGPGISGGAGRLRWGRPGPSAGVARSAVGQVGARSGQRLATGHAEHLTGDVAGFLRGEE